MFARPGWAGCTNCFQAKKRHLVSAVGERKEEEEVCSRPGRGITLHAAPPAGFALPLGNKVAQNAAPGWVCTNCIQGVGIMRAPARVAHTNCLFRQKKSI